MYKPEEAPKNNLELKQYWLVNHEEVRYKKSILYPVKIYIFENKLFREYEKQSHSHIGRLSTLDSVRIDSKNIISVYRLSEFLKEVVVSRFREISNIDLKDTELFAWYQKELIDYFTTLQDFLCKYNGLLAFRLLARKISSLISEITAMRNSDNLISWFEDPFKILETNGLERISIAKAAEYIFEYLIANDGLEPQPIFKSELYERKSYIQNPLNKKGYGEISSKIITFFEDLGISVPEDFSKYPEDIIDFLVLKLRKS